MERKLSVESKKTQIVYQYKKRMKTRNNSSKAFHNHDVENMNGKSFQCLVDVIVSKIDSNKAEKLSISAFKQIIQRCYNNKHAQSQLCQALGVPFYPGPVALNSLPQSFFQQQYLTSQSIQSSISTQIAYLFEYLKKTKQYFYCWIIYYNQELKLLTVKMMKKHQMKENVELLNAKYCVVGVWVGREGERREGGERKKSLNKQGEKSVAYSCYQNNSVSQIMMKKSKTKLKKTNQLSRHTENNYSLKSFNSASKTNSSSLKNQFSQKQSESEIQEHNLSESSNIKANQKIRDFKRKKEKLVVFADIKMRKSISTKNQKSKSQLRMFKSLDKITFPTKNTKEIGFKNQQKINVFRSLSNADKLESYKKLDSNIKQLNKKEKKYPMFEKKRNKSNSLLKHRRLSNEEKPYSSYSSLNSNQSQIVEIKPPEEKIIQNFKRKISTNGVNIKKKKIEPIQFANKNSFKSKKFCFKSNFNE